MILKRLYSEPKRIDVVFQNGLNIICSDKTEKSSARDTRNGTGKTTFIKLIDFCLLGEPDSKILNSEEFQKFTFSFYRHRSFKKLWFTRLKKCRQDREVYKSKNNWCIFEIYQGAARCGRSRREKKSYRQTLF